MTSVVSLGEVTYDDGAHYVGFFVQGAREGQGTLSHDGITTTGTWHSNGSQGATDIVGPSGYHFHGFDVDGEAAGVGELRDKNGNFYQGSFVRGLFEGEGTMSYANGGRYSGSWKAGLWDGQGQVDYADGGRYVGSFVNRRDVVPAARH